MDNMALKAGKSMDEMQSFANRLLSSVCVSENWDRLMERGVDILFEPGTHDYVAYDILWGAQNHPQVPVYYEPNGGHSQTPHVATAKDQQNRDAFLWNHFFGGDSLLKPPTSSHEVDKDKLNVSVSFNEGPQPISGRIWWMYDRAPAGSAPFLHVPIPEDQWMDMERDAKTGAWTATIPLKDGFSRIDFFSNHGHMTNGYKQYLSSPYTRVELDTEDAALNETLEEEEFHTELIGAVGGVLDHRVNWRSARPKTFNGHVYFTYIDPNHHPRIAKLSLNNGTVETDWVVDSTYTLTKQNDGHYYFTLGIDPDGYIHVVGNMHNGDSVNINHWRSNNPEDISAFTLKQGSEGPQGDYFTYPHMRNDLNGNLYYWSRIYREAPWPVKFGIGLSAHDVASQQWSMIGAPVPGGDQSRTVTTWEDNNEGNRSYQQPRLMIHFDRNNRMHIIALLLNHTPPSYAGSPHFGTDVLYAYSDDGGQTIHKSDGSQIQWPMRVESGAYQGEIVFSDYSDYLNLAVFLATDRDNNPIILAGTLAASDGWHLLRRESGTWVDYGNLGNDSPFGGLLRDPWGVMTLQLDDNKIIRFWDPDSPVEIDLPHKPIFVSPTQSSSIDASWMRDTGEMIYTVQDSVNDQIKLYRTRISRPGGNNPPVFTADPIDKPNATEGAALNETREGNSTSQFATAPAGAEKPPTHPRVSYGPEDRQWLNLYLPSGKEPAPVFLYAHHNGSTADDVQNSWANPTLAEGTAIVSWESIAKVKGLADFQTCAADAKVMIAWVKENAATYNFDINKIFIGGQSRGSVVSWELAHSLDPSIAGIYMGQALPGQSFNERSLEPITKNAPPIFLAYRKEPGAVGDIHDAVHGLRVLERYKELGIEDRAELVHSLSDTKNSQVMQFLPKFVRSVVKPKR
jgi:predicted esterase